MSNSAPNSIADTTLGLTSAEVQLLRQHQQIVAQQRAHQEEAASRGRGTSRHSNPSSRAASAASSGGHGRVLLDPRSLQTLYTHFENVMRHLQSRITQLEDATQHSVQASNDRAHNTTSHADAEIERMKRILAQLDALEDELDRVKHLRDVVKQIRARVDEAGHRLDRSQSSSHAHHHQSAGHGSGRHDPRRR